MKKILVISLIILFAQDVFAQTFYSSRIDRKWMATGGLGYARSLGELTNPGSYFDTRLNLSGGLQYRFTDRITVGVDLLAFQLSGDDQDIDPELNTRSRNLSFVSNNLELSALTSVSLFGAPRSFLQRKTINPFVFAGVGALLFDPRARVPDVLRDKTGAVINDDVPRAGEMVSLRKYRTERPNTYGRFAVVIPVGAGVRVKVSNYIDVTAQVSNRITFTDYLDDISGRGYPSLDQFDLSNPKEVTAAALSNPSGRGSIRGNPESDDYYLIFSLKAEMYIQGTFLNKVFGVGGKQFNTRTQKRGGLFNFKNRRPRRR